MSNENSLHPNSAEHLFDGPIPGQSLTNNPEQKYPWENPPEFTSQKQLTEKIFLDLLREDNFTTVKKLMSEGIPVMDIAQMLMMTGFQKGKMNPDMMLTQLEPTAYMLLAIAEKAGIDPVLSRDDDVNLDKDVDNPKEAAENVKNFVAKGGRFKDVKIPNINPAVVGKDIQDKIDNLDTSKIRASILSKQEKEKSLLGKPRV